MIVFSICKGRHRGDETEHSTKWGNGQIFLADQKNHKTTKGAGRWARIDGNRTRKKHMSLRRVDAQDHRSTKNT